VDAQSSGSAGLEFALSDDALPYLRGANELSRSARGIGWHGRYGICVPPLRRRAGAYFHNQSHESWRRSGV